MNIRITPSNRVMMALLPAVAVAVLACGRGGFVTQLPTAAPGPTATQPQAQSTHPAMLELPVDGGIILFADDFQDGQSDNWETSGWDVEQNGDLYYLGATGRGWAWVPAGHDWSNYIFHAGVRLETGVLFLSMNLTQAGRYLLRMDQDGTYLIREQPVGNVAILAQTGPLSMHAPHSVVLASQDGRLLMYVDGSLWIDYTDTAPITQGTIGISSLDGSRVVVDNIVAAEYAGPLPAGVIEAPPVVAPDTLTVEDLEQELAESPLAEIEAPEELEPLQPPEGALPDLVAGNVSWSPDPVLQGQPFQVVIEVANRGLAPAGAFTVRLHYHSATGVPDCSADFPGLAPEEDGMAFCNSVSNAQPGTSPTEFTVDVENEITESDEANNLATPTFAIAAADGGAGGEAEDGGGESQAALPDLTISTIIFNPDPIIQGQPFAALITVSNRGDADAGIFTVRLHFHPNTGLPDCNWDVPSLGAGGSIRLDCTRTTNAQRGGYRTDLTLDVEGEITESDETNNASNQPLTVAAP